VLGCARHTAALYDRGGFTRLGPLDTVTDVTWSRVRDDMSMGRVTLQSLSAECQELLDDAEPNRHELMIFREGQRVWEGPVSHIEYGSEEVTIEARDVMYYAYRLIQRTGFDHSEADPQPTLVQHMKNVLVNEFARREAEDPPVNVLPHVVGYLSASTATTHRMKHPFANTVFEEIDDIARYAGMDYTVIGRRILLFDTHTVFFQTPALSEADFLGPVIVSAYGLQHATIAAVTDGEGTYGIAGGPDPFYGHWEQLSTTVDEEGDPETLDQEVYDKQAASALVGANPVPFIVRVPDGSQLNPNGALSIDDLVPGARIPLRATLSSRKFSMMQKLDSVKVRETAGVAETITVNLSTASAQDEPMTGVVG
jgi:hypothetical protein